MATQQTRIEATDGKDGRWYVHQTAVDPDGNPKRYISVTNVTDSIWKYALMPWAAFGAAQCVTDNLPAFLKAARRTPCNPPTLQERCGECLRCLAYHASEWHKRESDQAKARGQQLHEARHHWILHREWPQVTEEVAPYVRAYQRFVADYGLTPDSWELTEAIVLNEEHGYAGMLDGVVWIDASATPAAAELVARVTGWPYGKILVVDDAKTRKREGDPRFFPEMALQMSAYRACPVWVDKREWVERPMPTTAGGLIVQVRPDGYECRLADTSEETFKAFLHCCHAQRWYWLDGAKSVGVKTFPLPDAMQGTMAGHVRHCVAEGMAQKDAKVLAREWHDGPQPPTRETVGKRPPVAAGTTKTPPAARRTPAARKAAEKAPGPARVRPAAAPALPERSLEQRVLGTPTPEPTQNTLPGFREDEEIPY